MSANEVDLQPTTDEVLQVEDGAWPKEPAVEVTVHGPVRTQELPHKAGATFTRPNITTTPYRILTADHRRARAVLLSIGQNLLIAFNSASAQDPSRMALWPANTQFLVTAATEVWVASATGTTSVSVATEMWAAGEGA